MFSASLPERVRLLSGVTLLLCCALSTWQLIIAAESPETPISLRAKVIDAESGEPIAARVYIQQGEEWFFAKTDSKEGTAQEYRRQKPKSSSIEMHSAVSAHPFTAPLPPGEYTITIERGKEYLPLTQKLSIGTEVTEKKFKLQRWINMTELDWYSGDTHVHLPLAELPTAMLAEDLNVAFPLTSWVTQAYQKPQSDTARQFVEATPALVKVDATHVYWPLNTEWEIFTVGDKKHALGALFAVGQSAPIKLGVPPVMHVVDEVRRQEALLELDKHAWPWSMMLVPVANVDLFELSNNHHWRVPFFFNNFYQQYTPPPLQDKLKDGLYTETSWTEFGFWNYYALLNCGFRMRPTAGTATGVHPVPLGFGRVYVEVPDGFSYEKWFAGLNAGRSFVSNGPLLLVKANDQPAGHKFALAKDAKAECRLTGTAFSSQPLAAIEVIVNGEVVRTPKLANATRKSGGFENAIDETVPLDGSSWVAVRCFEADPDDRVRFAHTSPFYFDIAERPLLPRRVETEYLLGRVRAEIERNTGVLSDPELEEFRQAEAIYSRLNEQAR